MSRRAILTAALLAMLIAPPAFARERGQDELRRDMEFAREQVYPALVNISVVAKVHSDGRVIRFPAAGSGVIVSPAGHVVTNYHVAGEATRIVCRLPSGESIEADVVAHDPLTDLSVLKLRLDTRKNRNEALPFARLGDSEALTTGDYVLAMGNPLTLSSSMTLGIVSNPKRVFSSFTGAEIEELDLGEGQLTGLLTRWIQHDALILPGNSGGPLVNLRGEVVGINELGGNGVGFAIPSRLVGNVLNQALAHGEIVRGWLGVELAQTEKLEDDRGVLVAFVQPGGAGEKAGLRAGDRLLAVAGEPVRGRSIEDLPVLYARFADLDPGRTVRVRFLRDGEEHETDLVVGRMEKYLADEVEDKKMGLTLRDITGLMAMLRRYPDSQGVLVTGVRPGRPADDARPGLKEGDVIRALDGKPVEDHAAYAKLLEGLDGKVAVRFRREDADLLTVVDLAEKERRKSGGELPKAWLGVKTQVLTPDVAGALGLGDRKGFRVVQVLPTTEAEKAGLRVGDVLVAVDGQPLGAWRMQDSELLQRRIESLVIGDRATLTVLRDGAETTIEVALEKTPIDAQDAKTAKDDLLEFRVRNLAFSDRIENRWHMDQQGVLVTDVTNGGWANLAGLRIGDLLLEINGTPIPDVAAFEKERDRIAEEDVTPVVLFVRRDYRTKFLFAEPDHD
jgi:serine protease Do